MKPWKQCSTAELAQLHTKLLAMDLKGGTPRRQRQKAEEALQELHELFSNGYFGMCSLPKPSKFLDVRGDDILDFQHDSISIPIDELDVARANFWKKFPNVEADSIYLQIESSVDNSDDYVSSNITSLCFAGAVKKDEELYAEELKSYEAEMRRYELLDNLFAIYNDLRGEQSYAVKQDPEYQEFLRLAKKFGKDK